MFHRMKSEAPNQPQNLSGASPENNNNARQPSQPQQQAARPEAPQAAKNAAQQSQQPINKTPETFYRKENQTMTDNASQKKTDTQSQDANAPRPLDIPGGNAFQRQQPGWSAANYPGYAAGNLPTSPNAGSGADSKLIIGRGITMSGEIKSCNHLIVEGTVEASLTGASVLDIAQSGTFFGAVEIEEATVAGNFEGDLTVSGRLIIRSTGRIKGSITYKELEVEAGALIEGRLSSVSNAAQDGKSRNKAAAQQKTAARPPSAKDAQKEAANNEGELFSGNTAAAE